MIKQKSDFALPTNSLDELFSSQEQRDDAKLERVKDIPLTESHAQSIRLKKLSQEGVPNEQTIYDILAEQKPNQREQYKFKREDIRKYFPKSYTDKQVCDTVIKLLEQWQRKQKRDRDSR